MRTNAIMKYWNCVANRLIFIRICGLLIQLISSFKSLVFQQKEVVLISLEADHRLDIEPLQ